nr:CoA transferase [Ramlibacter sp.]
FITKPKDYWVETLLANGLPAGPILSYPEAFGSEHAKVRGMRMEVDHPVEGKVPNIGFAVKLSRTPQQVRRHPPLLGEHTDEVLAELGIDEAQRHELRAQGAFGK